MATTACQPAGSDIFSNNNTKQCEKYVCSIQRKLDQAVADNDSNKIRWYVHLLSKRSRAVKILAIHHVTSQNKGRYTAGIDGVKMLKGRKVRNKQVQMSLLNNINIEKKPSPIRRVLIPKPNGKKRPLGILTIIDRIIQDILRMTIEPITEYYSSDNSYGFRPKRCCHDAIEHLFNKLSKRRSKQWILEGDIASCFDNIEHNHILDTLKRWHVTNNVINIIKRMLKSKIFSDDQLHTIDSGTQQGGILSPMLANVALTALDDYCLKQYGTKYWDSKDKKWRINNPIVRYADDFVIECKEKEEAIDIKREIATFLQHNIGLELSDEKTRITHISEGFDFLGFNFRKYLHKSPKSKYHQLVEIVN